MEIRKANGETHARIDVKSASVCCVASRRSQYTGHSLFRKKISCEVEVKYLQSVNKPPSINDHTIYRYAITMLIRSYPVRC